MTAHVALHALPDAADRRVGLVPIPAARRELAGVAAGETFDRRALELAARGDVVLVPHNRPAALPAHELAGPGFPALPRRGHAASGGLFRPPQGALLLCDPFGSRSAGRAPR